MLMRAKPETKKMMHGERKGKLASVKARKKGKTGLMQSYALRAVRSM